VKTPSRRNRKNLWNLNSYHHNRVRKSKDKVQGKPNRALTENREELVEFKLIPPLRSNPTVSSNPRAHQTQKGGDEN
jgi:hypothetical protein